MKLSSIPALLILFLAALSPFLFGKLLDVLESNYDIQYQIRDAVKWLRQGPYQPVVFGLFFGSAIRMLSQQHNRATREEVFAFTLLCALIQVCLQYGGALISPFLDIIHVSMFLFWSSMTALFLSLICWKGLFVNLGGIGVFLTTLLGVIIGLLGTFVPAFPLDLTGQWYTIVGTFIGLFAAFDRV
jgi:hypothetical protein